MIRSIKGLRLGDKVDCGKGITGVVTSFPTRYSIVLKNTKPMSGDWSTMKTSRANVFKSGRNWYLL